MLDNWWFQRAVGAWIQGLGGIGKSGLVQTWLTALEHIGYQERIIGSVFYMAAREIEDIPNALGKLASWRPFAADAFRLLSLDGYDESPPGTDLTILIRNAWQMGIRLIVTSRSELPTSLVDKFTVFRLDTMSQRDAIGALAEFGILGPDSEKAASEVGNHPLALSVFARYVSSIGRSVAEAVIDLKDPAWTYVGTTLHATLAATVGALTSEARRLFTALCTASNDGVVSLDKFFDESCRTPVDTIRELARIGLIKVDDLDEPNIVAVNPSLCHLIKDGPSCLVEEGIKILQL